MKNWSVVSEGLTQNPPNTMRVIFTSILCHFAPTFTHKIPSCSASFFLLYKHQWFLNLGESVPSKVLQGQGIDRKFNW